MRSSTLMIAAGAALLIALPQVASAAPMANGGVLKAAVETASGVETIRYYGRRYGYGRGYGYGRRYGYRGYGYGGYGYPGYGYGGYGYPGYGYGYGY